MKTSAPRAACASCPAARRIRDGAYLAPRRHLHAARVRQRRRLGRRGDADRLARPGRIVRADRRARAPQRRRADRRRPRAGRRAARHRRGRRARRRQLRRLRGGDRQPRAVLAAGTILTGSTPIYDLPNDRVDRAEAGPASRSSPRVPSSCPARAPVTSGSGREWGLSLATPIIVKYRDERTSTRGPQLEVGSAVSLLAFARDADRHRFHHRPRTGGGRVAGVAARGARLSRAAAARVRWPVQRAGHARSAATSCCRPTSTACRRSFPQRGTRWHAVRPRLLRRQGHPGGAGVGRRSGCAPGASVASACFSSSARSGAATARRWPTRGPGGSRFLINGEPTDNRLGDRDPRRPPPAADGARARRALGRARVRRVRHRQAARYPDAHADAAVGRRSGAGRHLLHARVDRRRHRAQRDFSVRGR